MELLEQGFCGPWLSDRNRDLFSMWVIPTKSPVELRGTVARRVAGMCLDLVGGSSRVGASTFGLQSWMHIE